MIYVSTPDNYLGRFLYKGRDMIKRGDFYGDPFHLLWYHSYTFAVTLAGSIGLYLVGGGFPTFNWEWYYLYFLPLGLALGPFTFALVHNASHNTIVNKHISRLVGEIMGVMHFWGFEGWKWLHIYHHRYSDDLEKDPHTPGKKTFWQFCVVYIQASINYVTDRRCDMMGKQGFTDKQIRFYRKIFSFSFVEKIDTIMRRIQMCEQELENSQIDFHLQENSTRIQSFESLCSYEISEASHVTQTDSSATSYLPFTSQEQLHMHS